MRNVSSRILLSIGAAVAAGLIAAPAQADHIQITVTNNQAAGGFALAPVWFGLQNSSTYSPFTPGSSASSAIATLAQFGNTAPLTAAFMGMGPETTLASADPNFKQFLPGESNSTTLNISNPGSDQYLSFAGMVVPSNDYFQGNATALQIFDSWQLHRTGDDQDLCFEPLGFGYRGPEYHDGAHLHRRPDPGDRDADHQWNGYV
ncbi:MAG: spondin domain-containing protein [Isosphaeraceae bacterium]